MKRINKCPYCGADLQENALFCPFCMQFLQNKEDLTTDLPKRRNRWTVPVLCLLVVVCLSIVGLLIHFLTGVFDNIDRAFAPALFDGAAKENDADGNSGETLDPDMQLPQSTPSQQSTQNRAPGTVSGMQATIGQTESTAGPSVDQTKPAASVPTTPTEQPTMPTGSTTSTSPTTQCSHVYKPATCTTPMTCTKCGATCGTVDAQAHDWKAITAIVRHEEKGHYETVQTGSVKKIMYRCFFCSYAQPAFESLDALREHMPVHSHYSTYEAMMSRPDLGADTYETWEPVYEEKWIVDQEAYDETIITGYQCSICAATK